MSRSINVALVALYATVSACGVDTGDTSAPEGHDCANDFNYYNTPWSQQGAQLVHNEPKTCPVYLSEAGELLDTYGAVKETSGEASVLRVEVWEGGSQGEFLGSDTESFYDEPFTNFYTAMYSIQWPAAQNGIGHDFIDVTVDYTLFSSLTDLAASLKLKYTSDACPQSDCFDLWP